MGVLLRQLVFGAIVLVGIAAFFLSVAVGIPLAIVGGAVGGFCVYVAVLYRTLVADPPPPAFPPPARPEPGEQPAYRQYFFGQATADLRAVVTGAYRQCRGIFGELVERIQRDLFDQRGGVADGVGTMLVICLACGLGASMVTATVAALLHVAVTGVLLGGARAGIAVLRLADTAMLRIRGITITCGTCHHRVEYPVYLCPDRGCGARHTDVRPGRYGVFLRTCQCRARLPTLLLLGSHRLHALCPYCGHALARGSGSDPESLLSFLGATASGKTRLMLTMVGAVDELTTASGGTVEFVGDDTLSRLNALKPLITRGRSTPPTAPGELPRAYSLFVMPARGRRRFVHLFDVAGERLSRRDDADELRYLGMTRSFVFVLDPLSVDALWQELDEPTRRRLHDFRARQAPQDLFPQIAQRVQALGADMAHARLAVAVSKNDLVAGLPPLAGVGCDSAAIEAWLEYRCGLGNLVRSMRHEFGGVRFFFTAAVVDEAGAADASVVALARWLLDQDGMSLGVGGVHA